MFWVHLWTFSGLFNETSWMFSSVLNFTSPSRHNIICWTLFTIFFFFFGNKQHLVREKKKTSILYIGRRICVYRSGLNLVTISAYRCSHTWIDLLLVLQINPRFHAYSYLQSPASSKQRMGTPMSVLKNAVNSDVKRSWFGGGIQAPARGKTRLVVVKGNRTGCWSLYRDYVVMASLWYVKTVCLSSFNKTQFQCT